MSYKHDSLTKKQIQLIECLLLTKSKREACEKAGISERTLYRYLENPMFIQALRKAKMDGLSHSAGRLNILSGDAVEILSELAKDKKLSPISRLQVAKTILDMAFKATEMLELEALEERVMELEMRLEEKGQ